MIKGLVIVSEEQRIRTRRFSTVNCFVAKASIDSPQAKGPPEQ